MVRDLMSDLEQNNGPAPEAKRAKAARSLVCFLWIEEDGSESLLHSVPLRNEVAADSPESRALEELAASFQHLANENGRDIIMAAFGQRQDLWKIRALQRFQR